LNPSKAVRVRVVDPGDPGAATVIAAGAGNEKSCTLRVEAEEVDAEKLPVGR
jgi:hypothetical protein